MRRWWHVGINNNTFELLDYVYVKGYLEDSNLDGWSGNNSDTTPLDIINNISVFRTTDDCPFARVTLVDTEKDIEHWIDLSYELTPVMYPNGRCCRSRIPSSSRNWTIDGLLVSVKNNSVLFGFGGGVEVYLSDLESANNYHRNKFNVDGEKLETGSGGKGYKIYNLKIYKDIYLENSRNYECKNYKNIYDYSEVLHWTINNIYINLYSDT